jgi:hypothetical protein
MLWPWIIFCSLAAVPVLCGGYFYIRYAFSPLKLWSDEVHRLQRRAATAIRIEQDRLQQLDADYRRREIDARREALLTYVAAIPVDRLEDYPGIGPATVARLREAGCRNLEQLQNFRVPISGLGRKRLADIGSASRDLMAQVQANLDAGGKEARDLSSRLALLKSSLISDRTSAEARQEAARQFLHDLQPVVAAARTVSFFRYYWSPRNSLVEPRMLAEPLPDLEARLARAASGATGVSVLPLPGDPASGAGRNGQAPPPATPTISAQTEQLRTLEIDPTAPVTAELIRRHFHLLSNRYTEAKAHAPDAEFVRLADSRLADIPKAAAQLLQTLGEELNTEPKPPTGDPLRRNADLDEIMGA